MRIFATSTPTSRMTPENATEDMDAEIEAGRRFVAEGLIQMAWMDTGYTRTFMILEAPSIADAKARFDTYPQVRSGLIAFEYVPVVGMPAVLMELQAQGRSTPDWWPRET
jgi:hypothetical protein